MPGGMWWWMVTLIVLSLSLPMLLVMLLSRRAKALRASAMHSNGMICPKCMAILEQINMAADDIHGDPVTGLCPNCRRAWCHDELRQYWDRLITDPIEANSWFASRISNQGRIAGSAAWLLRHRRSVAGILAAQFGLWLGLGVMMAAVRGVSLIGGLFTFLHMALVMSGFMLIGSGWKRRVGDMPCCAKCGYQRGPPEAQAEAPPRCPECGSNWNQIGGVVYGVTRRRTAVMLLGSALLAAGAVAITTPITRRGWQYNLVPTSSLIREITRSDSFTMTEWGALRTRTLTPAHEQQLSQGLLDKRLRKTFFSADADNWLVAQIAAGKLPQPLLDRYYKEAVDLWLIGPARVRTGEPVTMAIGTRVRNAPTNNPKPILLIGGYFVGEDPDPLERQDTALPAIMVGQERFHVGERDVGSGTSPQITITPGEAGVLHVKLELWIVYMAGKASFPIAWQADGTPALPAGVVAHCERRVVEKRIDVEP